MVFAKTEAERKRMAEELKDVAMRYRGKINFATVNVGKLAFLKDAFELDETRYPAFVLQTKDQAYTFRQDNEITSGAVEEFIETSLGQGRPDRSEL
jgi:protein disulfide-isomerase A1